ncbi:MAG: hypothetical protein AB9866_00790 [Syntrophobacteraceae bacterium]
MFADSLDASLKLTISGTSFDIPGGNIKGFQAKIHSYGFICRVSFIVSLEKETDNLFSSFTKTDLIEANLKLTPHFPPQGTTLTPLSLTGLVTEKEILVERTAEHVILQGAPILYRHYQVVFADPAQVLWGQHHPFDLLVDKSMKEVIDAHKGDKVSITYDWSVLDTKNAVNTLPLGIEARNGSFYDFIMWYVFTQDGVWSYSNQDNTYSLLQTKSAEGEAATIDKLDIEDCGVQFPETIRCNADVLNAYSESPQKVAITQDQAATGINRDYMDRYPVAQDFQNRQTLETQRLRIRNHEVRLTFQRFPTIDFYPGCLVKMESGLWSTNIFPYGKVYRVREITLDGEPVNPELTADHNLAFSNFNMNMEAQLELKEEKYVSLPAFTTPSFPIYVEGKVVSEQGDTSAETFQIYQDANTQQDQYKISIPLWTNQQVVAAFEPVFFSGHFYFPAYKNERVLVRLQLHAAAIDRFLDWRANARIPMDSQGNRLLMGQTATSQTTMSHSYVDSKPVLSVQRTSDKDLQIITLAEGSLLLQTKQDES